MDIKIIPKDSSLLHPKWVLACVLSAVYQEWKSGGGTWKSLAAFLRTRSRNGLDIDEDALKKYSYPKEAVSLRRVRIIILEIKHAGLGKFIVEEAIAKVDAWIAMSVVYLADEGSPISCDQVELLTKRRDRPHSLNQIIYDRRKARKRNLIYLNELLFQLYSESIYKTREEFLFAVALMIQDLRGREESGESDDGSDVLREWINARTLLFGDAMIINEGGVSRRECDTSLHKKIKNKLHSLIEPGYEDRDAIFFIVQAMMSQWCLF